MATTAAGGLDGRRGLAAESRPCLPDHSFFEEDSMIHVKRALWTAIIAVAVGGLSTAAFAGGKKGIIAPIQDAKFAPADPANPNGPHVAVLTGDPAKGKSTVLLKLKKGSAPLHVHSSDYHATLIQGTTKHWEEGQEEKDAKTLGPGSYWFQPGKAVHGDACLTDECIIFISWAGKMDFKPAPAPKK
jgi:quercetin dioxygenase-like cupin family protein